MFCFIFAAESLLAISDTQEIQLLLVDQDIDSVCFASNHPGLETSQEGDFAIDFLVPAPLKVVDISRQSSNSNTTFLKL
jgi:hypothetical protein